MLYCINTKDTSPLFRFISLPKQLYYNEETGKFYDYEGKEKHITDRVIMPVSNNNHLPSLKEALLNVKTLFVNDDKDIYSLSHWYEHIEPKHLVLGFTGDMIEDKEFLSGIVEMLHGEVEAHLRTTSKDFSEIIDVSELVDSSSPLHQAISLHPEETFVISEKLKINEDEYGKIAYQALVERGKVIKLTRINPEKEESLPPMEVYEFLRQTISNLPSNFPKTFILKIVSYSNMFDILDISPIEKSVSESDQQNSFTSTYRNLRKHQEETSGSKILNKKQT